MKRIGLPESPDRQERLPREPERRRWATLRFGPVRGLAITAAAVALAATAAVAARPESRERRVRLVLDGFDAPAGLAMVGASDPGSRALVDPRSTICPSDLGSFSDASVLGTRGGGLPQFVMATWDTPGVWRQRLPESVTHTRLVPDARLTRTVEGDDHRWTVEWRGGPRLVALKVNPPVSGLRVRDLEYHDSYPAAPSGAAFAIVAPDRVRPVVLVADGVAPVRFGAEELRAALKPGASRILERATRPGVRLSMSFKVPGDEPPVLREVRGFAWDAATGALVRDGIRTEEAGNVEFRDLGSEAVTVVVEALDASGHAWLASWDGLPTAADATVKLMRSDFYYRPSSAPGVDVAGDESPGFSVRDFVLIRGKATIETELGSFGWFVQPGEYEVRPKRASGAGSVRCIVRDGVMCEIIGGIVGR